MEPFHGGQKGARDSDAEIIAELVEGGKPATSRPQVPPFPASWDPSEAGDDGASSQTLKLPSAAQSPTVAGGEDFIPAAQPSPPTAFDRDSLFAAVNGGKAQQAFTEMAGAPLTEENLETLQENLRAALQGELGTPGTNQPAGRA